MGMIPQGLGRASAVYKESHVAGAFVTVMTACRADHSHGRRYEVDLPTLPYGHGRPVNQP
jgi:hypothetical protein